MNDMLLWNILAMIVLAIPCGIILKVCGEAMFSGLDPYLFIGMLMMTGLGYSVLIANLVYFREERKHD